MRIDYEYVKEILEVFLDSNEPVVNLNSFSAQRDSDQYKFIFHIEILVDKGLVEGALSNRSIGISCTINKPPSDYVVSVVPWRLTSEGHDFAAALAKPGVFTEIKEKFKTEGLSVVVDVAKK